MVRAHNCGNASVVVVDNFHTSTFFNVFNLLLRLYHSSTAEPYVTTATCLQRALAFLTLSSSGLPTSIHFTNCPVRSFSHSAGSSVSNRSLVNSSASSA